MDVALFVKAFAGLFAIMNPFVNLPMFLALTEDLDPAQQRRAATRTALYCVVMVGVIIATGNAILAFFGITVDHFRVAGGIVLLMIALGMLNGGSAVHSGSDSEQQHQSEQSRQGDIAFYPMTFPMIVGPGTIATLVVFTGNASGLQGYVAVTAAALIILILLFAVLWFAAAIGHHLSQTLRTIMTRLMGMILAAIAVDMVIAGLLVLMPGLAR